MSFQTNPNNKKIQVENVVTATINPSTEEKQDTQILHTTDQTATGTLAVLNDAVEMTLNAKANTVFQITYTSFIGKIIFEAQVDDVWSPIYGFLAGTGQSKTEYSNPASGAIYRCSSAGFRKIRVRLSQATSGSATIYAVATNVTSGVFINFPLPEGGNVIGSVGISSIDAGANIAKETGGNLALIKTASEAIQELTSRLSFLPSVRGIAADLRVTLLSGTVTTVTTVSTVTGITNIGGLPAVQLIPSNQNQVAILSNINNIII